MEKNVKDEKVLKVVKVAKKPTFKQVFWAKLEGGRFANNYQTLDSLTQEIDSNWDSRAAGKELQWNQIQGVGRGSRHC